MCCRGRTDIDTNAVEKDKSITHQLETERKKLSGVIRLLLLGAGESGKSTIAKQMKILHMGGFNPEEKSEYLPVIHSNIYDSIQNIIRASQQLDMPITDQALSICQYFEEPFFELITPELAERITAFWQDESVLNVYSRRCEFQLLDNTLYFVKNIHRICEKEYIPTDLDILQARAPTTGVTDTSFFVDHKQFVMVDVGGQRSERKKWIHCFENVTGVLFCVGLSAFDQTLYEDNETNRIHEALKLFHEICSSKWFSSTAIVLFLNKADLFQEKLDQGKSIALAFPQFTGGCDYAASLHYLEEKFCDVNDPVSNTKKEIYCHVTTATDTHGVRFVFGSVRTFLLNYSLKRSGLVV
jgi:GTPase SAR1 family protein